MRNIFLSSFLALCLVLARPAYGLRQSIEGNEARLEAQLTAGLEEVSLEDKAAAKQPWHWAASARSLGHHLSDYLQHHPVPYSSDPDLFREWYFAHREGLSQANWQVHHPGRPQRPPDYFLAPSSVALALIEEGHLPRSLRSWATHQAPYLHYILTHEDRLTDQLILALRKLDPTDFPLEKPKQLRSALMTYLNRDLLLLTTSQEKLSDIQMLKVAYRVGHHRTPEAAAPFVGLQTDRAQKLWPYVTENRKMETYLDNSKGFGHLVTELMDVSYAKEIIRQWHQGALALADQEAPSLEEGKIPASFKDQLKLLVEPYLPNDGKLKDLARFKGFLENHKDRLEREAHRALVAAGRVRRSHPPPRLSHQFLLKQFQKNGWVVGVDQTWRRIFYSLDLFERIESYFWKHPLSFSGDWPEFLRWYLSNRLGLAEANWRASQARHPGKPRPRHRFLAPATVARALIEAGRHSESLQARAANYAPHLNYVLLHKAELTTQLTQALLQMDPAQFPPEEPGRFRAALKTHLHPEQLPLSKNKHTYADDPEDFRILFIELLEVPYAKRIVHRWQQGTLAAAGLEQSWQDRLREAAGRLELKGWLRSKDSLLTPFEQVGALLSAKLARDLPQADRLAWERRQETLLAFSLLLKALSQPPSESTLRIASLYSKGIHSHFKIEGPASQGVVRTTLWIRAEPKAPFIKIILSQAVSGEERVRRLGVLRMGMDHHRAPSTPPLHLDLSDEDAEPNQPVLQNQWQSHLELTPTWSKGSQDSQIAQAFLDRFLMPLRQYLEKLPRKTKAVDVESFLNGHPDQEGNIPAGTDLVLMIPLRTPIYVYHPETLQETLEPLAEEAQKLSDSDDHPRVIFQSIPSSPEEVRRPSVIVKDEETLLPYPSPVPVIVQSPLQYLPYNLWDLVMAAVAGRSNAVGFRLLQNWTFEWEGEQVLALAVRTSV